MAERYEPPKYNPDDPSYQENFVYENNEGKNFGDDGTIPPNNDQTQSSASDNLQADLKSLRGDYGQNKDAVDTPNAINERDDTGKSKY
jgi:uncharacterized protein YgiB involved in biofilm formation